MNIVKSVECDGDSVTGDSMIECFLHSIGACGIMFYLRCSESYSSFADCVTKKFHYCE